MKKIQTNIKSKIQIMDLQLYPFPYKYKTTFDLERQKLTIQNFSDTFKKVLINHANLL